MKHDTSAQNVHELKGHHVLFCMMAFFGCMFAVNGTFLYFAITTHPGEDVEKSYLQGLHYNETLDARARQAALGWTASIGFDEARTAVLVSLQDASQLDLRGLSITGNLRHPSSRTGDQNLIFERRDDGLYAAAITPPERGTWSIQIDAAPEGDVKSMFEARKSLTVQ